jgi:hypothetical protein
MIPALFPNLKKYLDKNLDFRVRLFKALAAGGCDTGAATREKSERSTVANRVSA